MKPLIELSRLAAVAVVFLTSSATAATFTVVNTDNDGPGSLRQALRDANQITGPDTIVFALPERTERLITLTDDGLWASSDVSIINDRPGDVQVTIRAEPSPDYILLYRCFYVQGGGNLLLSGLTISGARTEFAYGGVEIENGRVTLRNCVLTGNDSYLGGALLNQGEATLVNCLISNNTASQGGGLYNWDHGKMLLQHCVVTGNSAEMGGGIVNWSGDLTLIDCTVSDNSATDSFAEPSAAGGITNFARLAITNCTLSGNQATVNGTGAVYTSGGLLTAKNCTFKGNKGTRSGFGVYAGAIADEGSIYGPSTLDNCTFSENVVDAGGVTYSSAIYANFQYVNSAGGARMVVNNCTFSGISGDPGPFDGGALLVGDTSPMQPEIRTHVEVGNCIFRRVSGGRSIQRSHAGNLSSLGHNLCDDDALGDSGTGPGGFLNGPQDIRNTDPMLGPLSNNGGSTATFALLAGSPAIDSGADGFAPTRDQRGLARIGTSDIGAFEFGGTIPVAGLANISSRAKVEAGDKVLIAGFIVTGSETKRIMIRAIGPSLSVPTCLGDPKLELHDSFGGMVAFNDNWVDADNRQEIIDSALAPTNDFESAILRSVLPGAYTAVVRGANTSGIALAEVYDLEPTGSSKLGNISSRAFVQPGDNVLIGGIIVRGPDSQTVLIRAIGPSLSVPNPLLAPELELHDGNGTLLFDNYAWRDRQEGEIFATGIAPSNDAEAAIIRGLTPGNYTAIVRGSEDSSGIALVEAYGLD